MKCMALEPRMIYKDILLNLNNFYRGWIVGKFNDAITNTINEVGIQSYSIGDATTPHYHPESIEFNIILSGECDFVIYNLKDTDKKRYIIRVKENDILKIDKYVVCKVIAIKDTKILCLRQGCGLDKINISDEQFYSRDVLEVSF